MSDEELPKIFATFKALNELQFFFNINLHLFPDIFKFTGLDGLATLQNRASFAIISALNIP